MKIHKVKRTDGLITVVFSKKNKVGDDDEFSMKCHDAPVAGFQKAFDALTPAVVQICELGEEYGNTLVVTGASFSYGGEAEVMGVVITAQKALCTANSPLIINTPHLPSEDVSGQGNEPTLSKKQVKALEELQRQTVNYVEGKRLQLELKLEGADDMKAKEEEVGGPRKPGDGDDEGDGQDHNEHGAETFADWLYAGGTANGCSRGAGNYRAAKGDEAEGDSD